MNANPPKRAKAGFPAIRRRARALAVQVLYEVDLTGHQWRDALRIHGERARGSLEVIAFSEHCIEGVLSHEEELDAVIHRLAPAWPVAQLPTVDRNILRLALYELRYEAEVPPKVVINEAVELAKTFAGEASRKFINGVLGSALAEQTAAGQADDSSEPSSTPSSTKEA